VALQLMQAGYQRVSVVRGGFPALVDAGVPMAPRSDMSTAQALSSDGKDV
jgi:hypothetical protein